MSILQEIEDRRSIRKYKSDNVKEEDILKILEAGRLAPSGSNTQPWRFVVVKEEKTKKAIVKEDHNQEWMLTAPVFLVCLSDISCRVADTGSLNCDENSGKPELKQIIRDSAVAIGYMMLEAQHLGLGTCWTGWFEQKDMKKVLQLPDYMYVNGIVTLGYADESPCKRPRKAMDELVRYERW